MTKNHNKDHRWQDSPKGVKGEFILQQLQTASNWFTQ